MKTPFLAMVGCAMLLAAALAVSPTTAAEDRSAVFDFDTAKPALKVAQALPITQTSDGVTAQFRGRYSVQSDARTHFSLSKLSGNYLYPKDTFKPPLEIHFGKQLTSITVAFATVGIEQVDAPATVQLSAYVDSTANPPVGSVTAQGAKGGETMPTGMLSFTSDRPFNVVEITVAPEPPANFLVDNIRVVRMASAPTPRRSPRSLHPRAP